MTVGSVLFSPSGGGLARPGKKTRKRASMTLSVRSEKLSDFRLPCIPGRYGDRQVVKAPLGHIDLNIVDVQEQQCRHQPGSFVTVQEWMILYNVEHVCRGHLEYICVKELPAKSRPRLGDSRLQEPHVPHAVLPAVQLDLIAVNQQYVFDLEKVRHAYSLRQAFQVGAELAVDLA